MESFSSSMKKKQHTTMSQAKRKEKAEANWPLCSSCGVKIPPVMAIGGNGLCKSCSEARESDALCNLTLRELHDLAKDHGIVGYSLLAKDTIWFLIKGDKKPNDEVRKEIKAWCMTDAPYNMEKQQLCIIAKNLGVGSYRWIGRDALIRGIRGNEVWYVTIVRLVTGVFRVLIWTAFWLYEHLEFFLTSFLKRIKMSKISLLSRIFGKGKGSNINDTSPAKSDTRKSLYIQGTRRVDLLAVLLQSYSDRPHEAIDSDMAQDILNQVIPNIDQCMREEIRIHKAKDSEEALANSANLFKEYENSDGTYITGMISAKQNDVPITVDITLFVNGIRSITGKTGIIMMKTPTSWAANLKVK